MLKLELTQGGLEEAVGDYIVKLGLNLPVNSVEFTATRGNNSAGILTTITLGAVGSEKTVEPQVKPAKASKKQAAKPKEPEAPKVTESPEAGGNESGVFPLTPEAEAATADAEAAEETAVATAPGKSLFG
jgi:hypothetical protein